MSHTEDLGYLFFPEAVKLISNLTCPKPGSNDYKIVNYFVQMWTDFAKTGYKNFFPYFIQILQTYILILTANIH